MRDHLKDLFERYRNDRNDEGDEMSAFKHLMESPIKLITETQIHMSWFFERRKLTHLWFKANRAKTLSMLKVRKTVNEKFAPLVFFLESV